MVQYELPSLEVLKHVVDAHCHPTDSVISLEAIKSLPIRICAMSTRMNDQPLVAELARNHPDKVIPCFGFHPWFSHWISLSSEPVGKADHYRCLLLDQLGDTKRSEVEESFEELLSFLPDPIRLDECLLTLRNNFMEFPTAMLGEVGFDRSARIPLDYFAEKRVLTPFTVPLSHQMKIFEAQVDVAVEFKRNISVHSVKAPRITVEMLDRCEKKHGDVWLRISVDLHSCGLSAETWKNIERSHSNVFLSLSTAINGRSPSHKALIKAVSPHRILVESDIHEIGQCARRTWDMLCVVAEIRGWAIEDSWDEGDLENKEWGAVRRIEKNWNDFVQGNHHHPPSSKQKGYVV